MNLRALLTTEVYFDPEEKLSDVYLENVKLLFNRYKDLLSNNKDDLLESMDTFYLRDSDALISHINSFCDQLVRSVELFYMHYPSKCYKALDKAIQDVLNFSSVKVFTLQSGYSFYRIRKSKECLKSQSELFHIPFNLRHIVSEQRFSLNGCPCLYLGNSIYTAWKESGKLDPSKINIMRLKTMVPLEFLDLRFEIYNADNTQIYDDNQILYYALIFPLIIATNQKTPYNGANFNSEYILSKKLTELVKDKYYLDGIMYSSTKEKSSNGSLVNFILPTKGTINLSGQCHLLKSIFETTDVIKWDELILKLIKSIPLNKSIPINSEIPELNLDGGNTIPYNDSSFGELEIYMENSMKTKGLV